MALLVEATVTGAVRRLVHATALPTYMDVFGGWKPLLVIVISVVLVLVLVGDTVALAVADAGLEVVSVTVGVAPGGVGGVVPVAAAVGMGLIVAVASGMAVLVPVAPDGAVDAAAVGEGVSPSTTMVPIGYCGSLSMW